MQTQATVKHLHRSTDDEMRRVDGTKVHPALCGRWEVREDFIDNAPMDGLVCPDCSERERIISSRA